MYLHSARGPVRIPSYPEPVQGIKRDCKALPLTVRQMIVQQTQLQAIKRREEVSALQTKLPCPHAPALQTDTMHIWILHFLLLMCHWSSV